VRLLSVVIWMSTSRASLDHRLNKKWVFNTMPFELLRRKLWTGALRAHMAIVLLDRALEPSTIRIESVAMDNYIRGRGAGQSLL